MGTWKEHNDASDLEEFLPIITVVRDAVLSK